MFAIHIARPHAYPIAQLLAGCALIMLATAAYAGNTIHVPADYATIQDAIDAADDGDEIVVAPGTYHEAINFLGKAITVRSSDGRDVTTISALTLEQPVSVVTFTSGEGRDSVLDGFTISGGHGTLVGTIRRGGGIYITESDPTIQNCRITGNQGQYGAGLGAHGNTNPLIVDCEFIGNVATGGFTSGGGALITVDSTGHILNCVFSGNSADAGGGLAVSNNSALGGTIIENSVFSSNTGNQGAAANVNTDGSAAFVDCTFQSHGPGVSVGLWTGPPGVPAMATFENCAFQGNSGRPISGGLFLHVRQSSFVGNSGGVESGAGATVLIEDSWFENNAGLGAAKLAGFVTISGSTFVGNSSSSSAGAVSYSGGVAGAYLLITDSLFIGNSGPIGGALGSGGFTTVRNCTFENNVAGSGGAIQIASGLIEGCIIRDNSATSPTGGGGGVRKSGGGTVTMSNTLIEGNDAMSGGGGIHHEAGTFVVIASSLVANSAAVGGGAIKVNDVGELLFESTLFCKNEPEHLVGPWTDLGGNTFHDECPDCAPADLDCDGSIGVSDLLILLAAWGRCADCDNCAADLDGDCTVGVSDLLILLANWGP